MLQEFAFQISQLLRREVQEEAVFQGLQVEPIDHLLDLGHVGLDALHQSRREALGLLSLVGLDHDDHSARVAKGPVVFLLKLGEPSTEGRAARVEVKLSR